ncbi:MAG: hypothetical protein JWM88_1729 [Verrucomicrobia bacterium]|nr:hypothetical protein [Verrucomicrobiota bacterium]
MKPRSSGFFLAAALLAAAAEAAVVSGGSVYAKRFETTLLSEPQPLAAPAAKVGVGRKLKVDEVRGVWLRVSDGGTSGWVFSGNVSETKPVEIKGLDGLPLAASKTTATAAARPLTPAAADYASRKNLGTAGGDLDWLLQQCRAVSDQELEHFLQEKKKGDFQ